MNFGRLDVEHAVSERNCNVPASRRHTWSWCQRLSTPARQAGSGSSNLPDHTVTSREGDLPWIPPPGIGPRFSAGTSGANWDRGHVVFPRVGGADPLRRVRTEFPKGRLHRVRLCRTRKRRWRKLVYALVSETSTRGYVGSNPTRRTECCRCEGMGYFSG